MKLNKQYFFAALIIFGVQLVLGSNWANAKPCEAEIKSFCSLSNSRDANWCYESERTHVEMNAKINNNLRWIDKVGAEEGINHAQRIIEIEKSDKYTNPARLAEKYMYSCFIKTSVCMYKNGGRTQDSNTFTDYKGCDGGSQSSSSSSSSQSNKKANRQSANNQSSSSSSSDLSNKSQEQLFEILDSAENRGDYAQAYVAEKQLAKDPSAFIKRQALRRIGYRYAEGRGVNQNLNEARRYFEQASSMGDLDASANLCVFNILGKGAPENHKKAMEYCLFAAEKGHATAQYNLAWLYQSGNGIQRDKALSDMWTCKAAAQGDEMAVSNAKKLNLNCN